MNLPQDFLNLVSNQLNDIEYQSYIKTMQGHVTKALRLNYKKINDDISSQLNFLSPVPIVNNAYYFDSNIEYGKSIFHQIGCYYIQDASAMLPALALNVSSGQKVLDLCAAPGGKSTQIAEALNNDGLLVANEYVRKRSLILNENIKRLGFYNTLICNMSSSKLLKKFPQYFDAILVDAPCSGEGMFRKSDSAIQDWSLANVKACAVRQLELLKDAYHMLKPGGVLVYSTCTLNTIENEEVVDQLVSKFDDLSLLDFFQDTDFPSKNGMLKLWPHIFKGEGQFIAKFIKSNGNTSINYNNKNSYKPIDKKQTKIFQDFCKQNDIYNFDANYIFNGILMQLPNIDFDFHGLNIIDIGLRLGTIERDKFVPMHSFAQCLDNRVYSYDINIHDAINYIKGAEIENKTDKRGYHLLTYKKIPLAWGKFNSLSIKNMYPKNLRHSVIDHI